MSISNMSQQPYPSEERLNLNLEEEISQKPSHLDPPREDWEDTFQGLFDRAVETFAQGIREPDQLFSQEDRVFLQSIGASVQEIYDFVEDWSEERVPAPEVIREVTGLRREYFIKVQEGKLESPNLISVTLPSPSASMGGHRWLPRIIAKARAKLRGELPPNIMYGCGMDRPFLQERNIALPEFLRKVWEAGEDDGKILDYVNHKAAGQDTV